MSLQPYVTGNQIFYPVQDNLQLQDVQLAAFQEAIAQFEGFYIPNSISQRHRNPGNLRPIGASKGFQSFLTPEEGWIALRKQIIRNIQRGLTLREFFLGKEDVYPGYAPLGDNPADVMESYIAHVAKALRIPDNVDLRAYFPQVAKTGGDSWVWWGFNL